MKFLLFWRKKETNSFGLSFKLNSKFYTFVTLRKVKDEIKFAFLQKSIESQNRFAMWFYRNA